MSWWPVAWSEELRLKPLAVEVADEAVVLFRGNDGTAYALEDRCPHRRAPLSLGRVTEEGELQCGYHGWIYAGGSGQCVKIPNFRKDERVSPRIKAISYSVVERAGVIFVDLGVSASDVNSTSNSTPPQLISSGAACAWTGETELSLSHETWMKILLHSPAQALGLASSAPELKVLGATDEFVSFEQYLNGSSGSLASKAWAYSGFTHLALLKPSGVISADVYLASLPLASGAVKVRWRYAPTGTIAKRAVAIGRLLPKGMYQPLKISQDLVLQSALEANSVFDHWWTASQLADDKAA